MNEGNLKFAAQHEAIVEAYKESKAGKGMYCTAMALVRPKKSGKGIECVPLPDMEFCNGHPTLEEAVICLEKMLPTIKEYWEKKLASSQVTVNKVADVLSAIVGKDMKKPSFKDHKIVIYVEKLSGEMIDIGEIIEG